MKKISLIVLLMLVGLVSLWAQSLSKDKNWQNLDYKQDRVMGVSSDLAYRTTLKNKKSKTIVVAIIDSGTDTLQEDLRAHIWTNPREIAGNGIDDDNNGYIDDIHGWSFLGNTKGQHITTETSELTRLYGKYNSKFGDKKENEIADEDKKSYEEYLSIKKTYEKSVEDNKKQLEQVTQLQAFYTNASAILKEKLNLDTLTYENLVKHKVKDKKIKKIVQIYKRLLKQGIGQKDLDEYYKHFENALKYGLNPNFNVRDSIIGDNPEVIDGKPYGCNDVSGQGALHGTHVAGIIGAIRNNGVGMNGIAANVKLMIIRAVPDGDERDKDVALAIRYAADNGARIINMSFGKAYSPQKALVDAAVRHADSLGVLMVHAAGNDGKNLDKKDSYPSPVYLDGAKAVNWITVGASAKEKGKHLAASFSNYGKKSVDLFAPGVAIYSTVPNNGYKKEDGTSMASPTAAGVAALVLSYYPDLSATELKDILMKSVTNMAKKKVIVPGKKKQKIAFGDLCVSGGIIDAENALLLAGKIANKK